MADFIKVSVLEKAYLRNPHKPRCASAQSLASGCVSLPAVEKKGIRSFKS